MPDHHAIVCGIGINLAQPQSYFDAMELPHGTSLALQGIAVDPAADAAALAESMTNFGFDRALYGFEREGFSAIRDAYKARCVNLGRHVTFDGGEGTALDVDEEGRLVVQGAEGSTPCVYRCFRRSERARHLRCSVSYKLIIFTIFRTF